MRGGRAGGPPFYSFPPIVRVSNLKGLFLRASLSVEPIEEHLITVNDSHIPRVRIFPYNSQ